MFPVIWLIHGNEWKNAGANAIMDMLDYRLSDRHSIESACPS